MNQRLDTIHWLTPGGMYIAENESLHEGEACLWPGKNIWKPPRTAAASAGQRAGTDRGRFSPL